MKRSSYRSFKEMLAAFGLGLAFVFSGCSVAKKTATPPPVAAEPAKPENVALHIVDRELPAGAFLMNVLSDPIGAIIVVDGKPVGHAPLQLVVAGSPRGFFRAPVLIRARFIAENSTEASQVVEDEFTAIDRVPATLQFRRSGAVRLMRRTEP